MIIIYGKERIRNYWLQDEWFKNHKEEHRKKMREKYHEKTQMQKRRVK